MFNASQKGEQRSISAETFIGPSVKLEGNFSGEGDVVVEGFLIGNLATHGDVRVGPQAIIEAEVKAKNAYIAGKIKGNLFITNGLKLAATASITGDIKTSLLSVEDGALVNGKILMSREKTSKNRGEDYEAAEKQKSVKVEQPLA